MPSYTGTYVKYYDFLLDLGSKVHNLTADTFKMLLLTNSYSPNQDTDDILTDITGVEASGSGYARQTITGLSLTRSSGTLTWTFDPVTFTVTSDLTVGYWALYNDTPTSPADPLVAYGDVNTSGTVTITTALPLVITAGSTFFTIV